MTAAVKIKTNPFRYQGCIDTFDCEPRPSRGETHPHIRATIFYPYSLSGEWHAENCAIIHTDEDTGEETQEPISSAQFFQIVKQHKLNTRILDDIEDDAQ